MDGWPGEDGGGEERFDLSKVGFLFQSVPTVSCSVRTSGWAIAWHVLLVHLLACAQRESAGSDDDGISPW